MRALFFGLAIAVFASSAGAAPLAVYGPGNMECWRWTHEREQKEVTEDTIIYLDTAKMWILGYLSAANYYVLRAPPAGDAGDAADGWVDAYCALNSDATVSDATKSLIEYLQSANERPLH